MKRKTTFLLYSLVGVILFSSACLWYVRAADQKPRNCGSFLKDYLEKTEAYEDAREALVRAKVATAKASPTGNVPPEWEEYEDEYDKNKDKFFDNLKDGLSTHPNAPSNTSGLLNGLSTAAQQYELMRVEAAAVTTYDAASAAQQEAETALANCQGQSIVTIWCERGAACQNTPGVSGNPKAHYVFDCPDEVEGAFNLNVDCPGQWWSCDGNNVCPRSSDHVVACKGDCGDMVGPDRVEDYHKVVCETEARWIGCGQTYRSCSETDKQAHSRSILGDICPLAPTPPPDNTPDCSYCTDGCSSCDSADDDDDDDDDSDSGTTAPTPSPPAPSEPDPPETVSCARSACGAEVSDRLAHRVDNCSNCGGVYWTCYPNATYNHETTFTCRRCGTSFTRCSNGTCTTGGKTYSYHWAE